MSESIFSSDFSGKQGEPSGPKKRIIDLIASATQAPQKPFFEGNARDLQPRPAEKPPEFKKNNKTKPVYFDLEIYVKNHPGEPLYKKIKVLPKELERLLASLHELELDRLRQAVIGQVQRSALIAERICSDDEEGFLHLSESSLHRFLQEDGQPCWCHVVSVPRNEGEGFDQADQPLNFFLAQHSWILENWLVKRANSWSLRRLKDERGEVIFQVSLQHPSSGTIEAEGVSREAVIVSLAEEFFEEES